MLYTNIDQASVLALAQAKAEAYKADRASGLRRDVVPSQVTAALQVAGVYQVILTSPTLQTLAENEWARCTAITLTVTGSVNG